MKDRRRPLPVSGDLKVSGYLDGGIDEVQLLHAKGVPELVVEIASKGTRKRDETIKRRLYERAGVSEYWVADPEIDVIRVYRRTGDGFGRPVELSREANEVLTTALLSGLELPLGRLFSD